MKRHALLASAVLGLATFVVAQTTMPTESTTQPATLPTTTRAAVAPTTRPRLMPYIVFNTRSIFMKGRVPPPPTGGTGSTTQPTSTSPARAEAKIVFLGVTEADGVATAVFEDTSAGKIVSCKAGDPLASGKITEVTIDSVTYESAGKAVRVLVGQNLDAGDGPAMASRATLSGSTTAPSGGDGGDDVVARMRAKRRQELGQ